MQAGPRVTPALVEVVLLLQWESVVDYDLGVDLRQENLLLLHFLPGEDNVVNRLLAVPV